MRCPYCSYVQTRVTDTRETKSSVRRRRFCEKCKKKFTTYEELGGIKKVTKRDGRIEDFDKSKIKTGIEIACKKRPIDEQTINQALKEIEAELSGKPKVSTTQIGKLVLKKLKKLDNVCFIRFASVHQEFDDVDSFEKGISQIKSKSTQ